MVFALMTLLVRLKCPRDGPHEGRQAVRSAGRVRKPGGIRRRITCDPAGEPGHTSDDGNSPQTTQNDARRARSRTEEITKRDDQ